MKKFTDAEIKFVKETKFTPTVYQCGEYNKTPFKTFAEAEKVAKEKYNVDLESFLDKCLDDNDSDAISLEYAATYLFYSFFTRDELMGMDIDDGLKFLQDFKYFCGFRKWDEFSTALAIDDAIRIYDGILEFYLEDGHMWNKEKYE